MESMDRLVQVLIKHTNLSKNSRFLDVGSGLGKPNLHVAQSVKVELSIGIECVENRHKLSLTHLKKALELTLNVNGTSPVNTPNCYLVHGNICDAINLNPFTHVYMFDIG